MWIATPSARNDERNRGLAPWTSYRTRGDEGEAMHLRHDGSGIATGLITLAMTRRSEGGKGDEKKCCNNIKNDVLCLLYKR